MVGDKLIFCMSSQLLKQPLERLHDELRDANDAEPEHVHLLGLQESTRQLLEQLHQSPPPAVLSIYHEELKNAIAHFEATHPKISLAAIKVIATLNRIGI